MTMKEVSGFSLLELLFALALLAVLLAVAAPAHEQLLLGAERRAAAAAVLDIALRQEQHVLVRGQYAQTLTELGLPEPYLVGRGAVQSAADAASYAVRLLSGPAQDYRVEAAPLNAQLRDLRCGALLLDADGRRDTTRGDVNACWR